MWGDEGLANRWVFSYWFATLCYKILNSWKILGKFSENKNLIIICVIEMPFILSYHEQNQWIIHYGVLLIECILSTVTKNGGGEWKLV